MPLVKEPISIDNHLVLSIVIANNYEKCSASHYAIAERDIFRCVCVCVCVWGGGGGGGVIYKESGLRLWKNRVQEYFAKIKHYL